MSKSVNGKPEFDFSSLSWGDSEALEMVQYRTRKAQEALDLEEIRACQSEVVHYVARVLVTLPREWMLDNAPDAPDWHDAENIRKYVRGDKIRALLIALQEAQTPEASTKN